MIGFSQTIGLRRPFHPLTRMVITGICSVVTSLVLFNLISWSFLESEINQPVAGSNLSPADQRLLHNELLLQATVQIEQQPVCFMKNDQVCRTADFYTRRGQFGRLVE